MHLTAPGWRRSEPDPALRASTSVSTPPDVGELFDDHARDLYRYLARRVGPSAAEDLLGRTFLTAVEQIERFDPARGHPRAWLFGIAARLIQRHHRDEARQLAAYARLPLTAATDLDTVTIAARADAAAQRGRLIEALRAMADDDREVLLFYAWADLSYAEIAQALDIPLGTVRSRLHRARRQVRAHLSPVDLPPERPSHELLG